MRGGLARVKSASELFIASHYLCKVYVFLLDFLHSTIFKIHVRTRHSVLVCLVVVEGKMHERDTTPKSQRDIYGEQMSTHTQLKSTDFHLNTTRGRRFTPIHSFYHK